MTKQKTEKIINPTICDRRFEKIMRYNIDQKKLSKYELELTRQFFTIGWHQAILHSIDVLENNGEI